MSVPAARLPAHHAARRGSGDQPGGDFTADVPGTRLVGDITYLKTGEGWLYLATVIDLATRMVHPIPEVARLLLSPPQHRRRVSS